MGISKPRGISKLDAVSLAQVRARFSELVQEVKAGAEKIITTDGEPYVALIDAERLDHFIACYCKGWARTLIPTLPQTSGILTV